MEEVSKLSSGEVGAMFGVDCASMDTFSDGDLSKAMSSMFVPDPVMSLAVSPKLLTQQNTFAKAIGKFTKEDPTFKVKVDDDSKETILSGMGELHLEVYIERMKREYDLDCNVGQPAVNYKETIHSKVPYNYTLKKQTGGQGQFARVIGYLEPISKEEMKDLETPNEFQNLCTGTNIPSNYYPSCAKGANDAMEKGALIDAEVQGVRVVLLDGANHAVDSSDLAFRTCMAYAIRNAMREANPSVLQPIMNVEVEAPAEFQGNVIATLNKRLGVIQSSDLNEDGSTIRILCQVPLAQMFGYSTELRSTTQGKGEFTMEYFEHEPTPKNVQQELVKKFEQERE